MPSEDPKKIEGARKSSPNVVYVVDGHGEGWYCTEVDQEDDEPSGECIHEEEVTYDRNF